MHTVVPALKSKTRGGKLVSSPNIKNQSYDSPILHLAVQNCNGLRKESHERRLANAMDANAIEVCCLTETHLPTTQTERWDSGHALLTSGTPQTNSRRGTQGVSVCFSKKAVLWFEAAGSQFIPVNGRFCSFRLPVGTTRLHFIVCMLQRRMPLLQSAKATSTYLQTSQTNMKRKKQC